MYSSILKNNGYQEGEMNGPLIKYLQEADQKRAIYSSQMNYLLNQNPITTRELTRTFVRQHFALLTNKNLHFPEKKIDSNGVEQKFQQGGKVVTVKCPNCPSFHLEARKLDNVGFKFVCDQLTCLEHTSLTDGRDGDCDGAFVATKVSIPNEIDHKFITIDIIY